MNSANPEEGVTIILRILLNQEVFLQSEEDTNAFLSGWDTLQLDTYMPITYIRRLRKLPRRLRVIALLLALRRDERKAAETVLLKREAYRQCKSRLLKRGIEIQEMLNLFTLPKRGKEEENADE